MSANSSHQILHRMVPLICQALTTSPTDEVIWLEGLRLLCDPKLHTAMTLTPSIWLPLLLRGLELSRPSTVILSALTVLGEMAETLEPMKSCLVKPLKALATDTESGLSGSDELALTVTRLGLVIRDGEHKQIGRPSSVSSTASRRLTSRLSGLRAILPSHPLPHSHRLLQTLATTLFWRRFWLAISHPRPVPFDMHGHRHCSLPHTTTRLFGYTVSSRQLWRQVRCPRWSSPRE